ncbi:MAG TPA: thymidine kinase [Leadbetterella sp.]|jgi:thymidine kinase|nr:thymidine kinase [Leadbetterella sp.]
MFIEPKRGKSKDSKSGWIEVITGSMFSGKTEELIRRLKRAQIAKLNVEIFKPSIDVRYDETDIVSHNQNAIRSTPVNAAEEILLLSGNCDVVGIDEAQFLDSSVVDVCNKLAFQGKRVIVAGLDMDSRGLPFGPIPQLLAVAEYVTKVHAICVKCGDIAHFSFRKIDADSLVLLGEHDIYEARCRTCYQEA